MRFRLLTCFFVLLSPVIGWAQNNPKPVRAEEKAEQEHQKARVQEQKAAHANIVEIEGEKSFGEKEIRSQLKEQIATLDDYGLTPARADDAAFFLELFYRKHGFAEVEVKYAIGSGNHLRLEIKEGPRVTIGAVNFIGNETLKSEKLFEYAVGPTRERYSKAEKKLPYVKSDIDEGVDLVRRLYISEGFLNVIVPAPHVNQVDATQVDLNIAIVEGRRYSFGDLVFTGNTVYDAQDLQKEIADILREPYTDRRLADIPRRLQTYYKARGYYSVKVDAAGNPQAARGGRVPVRVTIS